MNKNKNIEYDIRLFDQEKVDDYLTKTQGLNNNLCRLIWRCESIQQASPSSSILINYKFKKKAKEMTKSSYVLEKTQQLIISHEEHNTYFYNHIWPEKTYYSQEFPHN